MGKLRTKIQILFLLIVTVFLSGCIKPEIVCDKPYMRFEDSCCLDENNNSICDEDEKGGKEKISSEESYGQEKGDESKEGETSAQPQIKKPKNEIIASSGNMKMRIYPSVDEVIKEVVVVEVTKVPNGTNLVAFVIQGPGIEDVNKTGPNLGIDEDRSDGWNVELDTGTYANGEFTIGAFASDASSIYAAEEEGVKMLGVVSKNVVIQNSEEEIAIEAPEIGFYRGAIILPSYKVKKDLTKAKEMDANAVVFLIVMDYKDGKFILHKNWKTELKSQIREAYRNGLAVSLRVLLPSGWDKNLPHSEESDYDLPNGYDVTPFIENMKEVYSEIAIFAEENNVYSVNLPIEIEAWMPRVFEDKNEYWEKSSKIDVELTKEIRKNYSGEIVGELLGGMWGYDAPCCYTNVPVEKIDFGEATIIGINTGSDYRTTGSQLGFVEEGLTRVEFTRNITDKKGIKKLYTSVGGYPIIGTWKGNRTELYSEFFEKSQGKVDGYVITIVPEEAKNSSIYDNNDAEAAKIWYKRIKE